MKKPPKKAKKHTWKRGSTPRLSSSQPSHAWAWVALLLILVLDGLIRSRLLDVPLYRDEGEYAYMGQLLLQGVPPYAEAYNMKFPGIYFFYALVLAVFGETHRGIHLGLLVVNSITIILVFLLGKRVYGSWCGIVAAGVFAVLTLSPSVEGFWANSEHFVMLPVLGGILSLLNGLESGKRQYLFLSGVLLGAGAMIKQHGALFTLFAVLYISYHSLEADPAPARVYMGRMGIFVAGCAIPFSLVLLYLLKAGVFPRFWFWTFTYAASYVSSTPIASGLANLKNNLWSVVRHSSIIWILAVAGLGVLWRDNNLRTKRPFMTGVLVFSFLSTCPGLYFRSHYFILFFPAVALLAGIAAGAIAGKLATYHPAWIRTALPVMLTTLAICSPVYAERNFLFRLSPDEACRELFGSNPFPESLVVAAYIEKNTKRDERIAVVGSEPQIYFYSHRRSATGYIYTYALMENQKHALSMQKEMIREIEAHQPRYIIFANIAASWLISRDSEQFVLMWLPEYLKKYYEQDGIVDILSKDHTEYIWGSAARDYTPLTLSYLSIYRRKVEPAM